MYRKESTQRPGHHLRQSGESFLGLLQQNRKKTNRSKNSNRQWPLDRVFRPLLGTLPQHGPCKTLVIVSKIAPAWATWAADWWRAMDRVQTSKHQGFSGPELVGRVHSSLCRTIQYSLYIRVFVYMGLYFFNVPGPGCLTMGYASEVCFGGMLRGMLRAA